MEAKPPPAPLAPASTCQSNDNLNRTNKVLTIHFVASNMYYLLSS